MEQTFQMGAREDGFDIDKIAFGSKDLFFTVDNLNKGEAGSTEKPEGPELPPALADSQDKFLGSCYGSGENDTEFLSFFNQVTPENAGKWGSVEGTRDQMNWGSLDKIYKMAKDNGLKYKHHVLIWGSQQPSWISNLPANEQLEEIEEWMAAVADRYPEIDQIEVVNEPLAGHAPPDGTNNHANYADALGGKGETGWDWIITSFELARKYFPNTQLLINEYGIINSTRNTKTYCEIIKLLNDRELIDGICYQAHGFSMNGDVSVMKQNLDDMAAFGLPIYPSELDIDGETDKKQLQDYQDYFKMFWEHPSVQGITLWGYTPNMWRGQAWLVNNGVERPAFKWLKAYLNGSYAPAESIEITSASDENVIPKLGETLQLTAQIIPDTATIKDIEWKVNRSALASIDENGLLTAKKPGTITVTASSIELNTTAIASIEIEIKDPTSIADFSDLDVRIYPNPSQDGRFAIEGLKAVNSISVYDLSGRMVLQQDVSGLESTNIAMNTKTGVYVVKFVGENSVSYSKIRVK